MAVLQILCAVLLIVSIKAQCIPAPCQPQVVATAPVVGTTIVDNTVSNALANALQLLIVSNLIENTMNCPGSCSNVLQTVAPLCDSIPMQVPMYPPAMEIITPDCGPCISYNPIPSCDIIAPCEPTIDIIYYPDTLPGVGCNYGFENPFIPDCGCNLGPNCVCGSYNNGLFSDCGCNYIPNYNIGCSSIPILSDYGCNFAPNYCNYGNLPNILPSISLPNVCCDCNNFGCDQCGPIISEIIYPSACPPQVGCSCGSLPIGLSVDPWGYDSYCNPSCGNVYYY